MAFNLKADFSGLKTLGKDMEIERGKQGRAVMAGLREGARGLEKDLENAAAAAGLGRLARAWKSLIYPRTRASLNGALLVYASGDRAAAAFKAHTEGAVVRARNASYLAVPLPNVPRKSNGAKLLPKEVEQRFGNKLQVIEGPGGKLLLALIVRNQGGQAKRVTRRSLSLYQQGVFGGQRLQPMFVLQRTATLSKVMEVSGLKDKWAAAIPVIIARIRRSIG